jgi:hypothetical protein
LLRIIVEGMRLAGGPGDEVAMKKQRAEGEPFEIKERCEGDFCIPHNILKIFSTVAKDSLC